MWGPWGDPEPPKPDEGPSGVRGNRDKAMTVRQREPVWELNPLGPIDSLFSDFPF